MVTLAKPGGEKGVTYLGPSGPVRFLEGRADVPVSVALELAGLVHRAAPRTGTKRRKADGMTEKTVHGMQAEHGQKAAGILNGYHATIDAIRGERQPEAGAYLDRLTDEQRMDLMREQKTERAGAARREALEAYTAAVEGYHEGLQGHLKGHLFGVGGPDGAAALSRTVTASEGELAAYLDVAEQAGNRDLARAVFVAAKRRGSGDLMARYFDNVDPEARELYQEWAAIPPAEVLERQREGIERVVAEPDPDRLMPPPRVGAY